MKMNPVKSSNIESVGYNPEEQELHVKFKSGKTFAYDAVDQGEFDRLISSPSVGSTFANKIKPHKACVEITFDDKDQLISKQALQLNALRHYIFQIETELSAESPDVLESVAELVKLAIAASDIGER